MFETNNIEIVSAEQNDIHIIADLHKKHFTTESHGETRKILINIRENSCNSWTYLLINPCKYPCTSVVRKKILD